MHIALDCGDHDLRTVGTAVALIHEWLQYFHGVPHYLGGLHYLRQEHLSLSEQAAYRLHSCHERTFDHLYGLSIFLKSFLDVFFEICSRTLYQSILQSFLDMGVMMTAMAASAFLLFGTFSLFVVSLLTGNTFCLFNQPLGRLRVSVENHILHASEKFRLYLIVNLKHGRIHDCHVHSCLHCMVQECRVHSLADRIVTPERE